MRGKATRAEIVIMAGAVATIIGSFFGFYTYNFTGTQSVRRAWDAGLSPITLYPVFAGLFSGGVVAMRRFANATLSIRLGSFTWEQFHLLLGLLASLIMAGYFLQDKSGLQFGLGFWAMLAGSIALLVGGVMIGRERHGPRGLA